MALKGIKRKLNTGRAIDSKVLISAINDYSVVSFDIFDTLLKRNVYEPKDVFKYMEHQLGSEYEGFVQKRICAEKTAREKKSGHEITLEDIYNQFDRISDKEKSKLIDAELCAEERLLMINDDMFPVFKACIAQGKKVILISDMYLPEDFIIKILKREEITSYKKLYLSSTIDKTKSTGALFEYAINEQKINIKDLIHIGDSVHSDYKIPMGLGIEAIHIPTHTPKGQFHLMGNEVSVEIMNVFLDNTSVEQADNYYRFGYEKFGMFLWGYSRWLRDELQSKGIKKVYFFSRDGLIMKKAFDQMYQESEIKTHYLEVSRRSLRVPILWMDYKLSTVIDMISPSKLLPLRTVFDGVGLDINHYRELIMRYGFDINSCFDRKTVLDDSNLADLYAELSKDIEDTSKAEYEVLIQYLKQNEVEGKFAIVDIGWSGGMQRYLCETLTKLCVSHEISGYYIGVADYYKRNVNAVPDLDLNGYLFDFLHDDNAVDKRSAFVGLFETLFLEQDGSVQKYEHIDDAIKAKRWPYEYIENGQATNEYMCVQRIQQGALDFIKRIAHRGVFTDFQYTADELFSGLKQTGLNPNKKDLDMFAEFRFFDEGETQYLANPKSIWWYFIHLKELKRDFLLSRWKIGFMKRLFVIKLPYEKMYRAMLKYK